VAGVDVWWVVPEPLDAAVIKNATSAPTSSATIEMRMAERRNR